MDNCRRTYSTYSWEYNSIYTIRKNIEKGKKYKICYLDNTLIKYIVYSEEIKGDMKNE